MCDTLVALNNLTVSGGVIFGKNSDREKDEPQIVVKVPRRKHNSKRVRCTYIEVEQVEETYECILSKPSWIWGAEMGVNEYGVVIGNEAVFTKEKQGPTALLGMDILRLALERSKTALEAVKWIVFLIGKYGQGGKCGYTKNLRYHNSYIVADFNSAYVLETADKIWALKKIDDVWSISNSLSLRDDFDMLSDDQENYNEFEYRKITNRRKIDFKKRYENKFITAIAAGNFRRNTTYSFLQERKGALTVDDFKYILRYHHNLRTKNIFNGSMKNICMHQRSLIGSETTNSMIVELVNGEINIWTTASSLPCLSIYKPLWFIKDTPLFAEDEQEKAIQYWKKHRYFIEKIERGVLSREKFMLERNTIEKSLIEEVKRAKTIREKSEILKMAWKKY